MSLGFAEMMHLDQDLFANDISGSLGCNPISSRTSLLVEPFNRELQDDQLWLHFKRFAPEGFGREFYSQDFVQVPPDTFLDEIVIQWDSMQALPPNGSRIWMR